MDSQTNKQDFLESKGYVDTHRSTQGGVFIEHFHNILSVIIYSAVMYF